MRRTLMTCLFSSVPLLFGSGNAWAAQDALAPQGKQLAVAVLDFGYTDTSGEARDQTAAHRIRLETLDQRLRTDLSADGFRVVAPACRPQPCEVGRTAFDELMRAAKEAGANLLVMGAVHKESTLVQWVKTLGVKVDDGRVAVDKLYTFRGDSDEAWAKAETFIAEDIRSATAPETKPPVKLAVFEFELLDVSAGGGVIPEDAFDAEQLRLATDEARRLIAQSGRYSLVDVSGAKSEPARSHTLHECGGCEAQIAGDLGADQSMLGVVTRVTRTDYNVTYSLRDAHTGKVLAVEQTDLRIGANYSWPRGAASLIKNKFLAENVTR